MKLPRRYDPMIIGLLALTVRLIYVWQLSPTVFFAHPVIDAEFHDAWARQILRDGIGHEGVFFRAPLYPYFLALVYQIFHGSFMSARIVQAWLGSLTAVLTYLLAWRLTSRRALALMAGCGAALYGMLVYFDGELLAETLFIPLLLCACLFYARLRTERKALLAACCGLFLGLAAIARPSALVLLPIFIMDSVRRARQFSPGAMKPTLKIIIGLLFGGALAIAPVTWHNKQQGDTVLIATSGGINFYIGNNSQADGLHSVLPGLGSIWDVPAASWQAYNASGRELSPSEVSAYYARKAWRFILREPAQALKLFGKKLLAFWSTLEISNNRDPYFFKQETAIMPFLRLLGFWLVGPLGLFGWWIGWRERKLPGWFLASIPIYALSVVAFFVTARFRAPLIPFLLLCGSLALHHLIENRRGYSQGKRWGDIFVLAIAFVVVNANLARLKAENSAHAWFCLGNAHLDAEHFGEAEGAFCAALAADSLYPRAHLNLGVIAYRRGDSATAEAEYQRELTIYPQESLALNNLGALRFQAGRFQEASNWYQRALDLEPYYGDARSNLAQSQFRLGLEEAEAGDVTSAQADLARAVEFEPKNGIYRYNYALVLGRLGRIEDAQEQLRRTLAADPDFIQAKNLLEQIDKEKSLPP